jgi:signal transduction histidine kinase
MTQLKNDITAGSTTQVNLSTGRHIVYTYMDTDKYLENVTSFIAEGIEKNEVVVCVDQSDRFDIILKKLKQAGFLESQLNEILFADANIFYGVHDVFNINCINENLAQLIHSSFDKDQAMRIWGAVAWKDQEQEVLRSQMNLHEHNYDCFISENPNLLAVCAYNALKIPASFLNIILKTHEFHMTDADFSSSHFYNRNPVLLSGIAEQIRLADATEKETIHSEKLNIASKLGAVAAHELGNPLAVMKGFLQLINKTDDMSNTNRRYLNTISTQVEKIEHVTSEFLALANPHLGNKLAFNFPQLVADVQSQMYSQTDGKAIEIKTQFDHDEIMLFGDKVKIKQALINLIKNALEAMTEGYILLVVRDTTDHIHIDVIDNGPGISNDVIAHIGEPFVSTKESGTGLGLLISKQIIAGHNGQLTVESEVGQGTRFTMRFPKS